MPSTKLIRLIIFGILIPAGAPELFLTKYILEGNIAEAKAKAKDNLKFSSRLNVSSVVSYSGYFTVNNVTDSHLFFWFFPAQKDPANAPVILTMSKDYLSTLFSVLGETGPFYINQDYVLKQRVHSWTNMCSVLYVDSPVGTGFSFTTSPTGMPSTIVGMADHVFQVLKQFYGLFPEYYDNGLYLAGELFSAYVLPYVAKSIHEKNAESERKINLKGLFLGSPYNNLPAMTHRTDYLQKLGLLDERQATEVYKMEDLLHDMINTGRSAEAIQMAGTLYVLPDCLICNMTGYKDLRNALEPERTEEMDRLYRFLDSEDVHEYLHVGLRKFSGGTLERVKKQASDFMRPHTKIMEEILDLGYKVLFYCPQFDLLASPAEIWSVVKEYNWRGAKDFLNSTRTVWRVNGKHAGYMQSFKNFHYVLVRNAGNNPAIDQPERVLALLEIFVNADGKLLQN